MALSNEELDGMQKSLLRSYNYYSKHPEDESYAPIMIESVKAIMMVENELRLRTEYRPHSTLQK